MSGKGGKSGTVRGPGFIEALAFIGLGLVALAAMAGQLVAVLPARQFGLLEYTTGGALLGGVTILVLSTHMLSLRLKRSNARVLESTRTADALRGTAASLIGLRRVDEVEAVATQVASSLASSPGTEHQATFYEIAAGTAVATADDGELGQLMGLVWELRDNPLVEKALREGSAVAGPVDGSALSPELRAVVDEIGITHAAAVPVRIDGLSFGALTIASCGAEISTETLDVLTDLVHIVELSLTLALANERTENLAQTEPITGLLNRRGLEQVVETMRGRRPFVVLAFELEGLTTLQDEGAHEARDELICRFAEVARSQMRRSDVFSFVGGYEFLAVLFDAVEVDAEALAFRVVNAASEHSVGGLPIRASIGIATGDPSDLFDDVVRRADAGLDIAKHDGGGTDFAEAEA